ncbi:MAG: hypothetical protein FWC78_06810 [Defluviitaleaceae bacterium]|nr:hypothetical protein [Defluviitaleaceae bacterium]
MRKLLIGLTIFHAVVNTLYLVRFFGVWPPEAVVYGYVPWFMSFALPNTVFTLLAWLLLYALLKRASKLAIVTGLLLSGGLIFHALNGLMFGFHTGYLQEMSLNALFEIVVYMYGLGLAGVYVWWFLQEIVNIYVKDK